MYTVPRKSFVLFLQENEAFFVIDRLLIYLFTALLLVALLTSPLIIPSRSTSFLYILPITFYATHIVILLVFIDAREYGVRYNSEETLFCSP
ncbi:hypothetical protein ccbrp13_35310 [Ktedonobacteria bacterium brp13]|nr:hypothetical protein ccbrp13_35310 [Ktedonobacteria bacterium brp13]